MANDRFCPSVSIKFGRTGQVRHVTSVLDATECLISGNWPDIDGPMWQMAAKAMTGAMQGHVKPDTARQAFADAALEARILVDVDVPR